MVVYRKMPEQVLLKSIKVSGVNKCLMEVITIIFEKGLERPSVAFLLTPACFF